MGNKNSIDILNAMSCAVDVCPHPLPTLDSSPMGIVCPSTHRTLAAATRLQQQGLVQVVGEREFGCHAPVDMLERLLHSKGEREDVIVFSDQIVRASDASVLIHADGQTLYLSAFEAVLNIKYGYTFAIWNVGRFVPLEARQNASETIFRNLIAHLQQCALLEDNWLAKGFQHFRSPSVRRAMALRKIRTLKSSVLDLLSRVDNHEECISLLGAACELERRLIEEPSG